MEDYERAKVEDGFIFPDELAKAAIAAMPRAAVDIEEGARAIQVRYWRGDLPFGISDVRKVCEAFARACAEAWGMAPKVAPETQSSGDSGFCKECNFTGGVKIYETSSSFSGWIDVQGHICHGTANRKESVAG